MPGSFMDADIGFPELSRYDTTEEKLAAVQNYLYQLLEMLRYLLRNLTLENFSQETIQELERDMNVVAETVIANTVISNIVVSNTVISNELYSMYGAIADLVVNELRTDYKRAMMYLAGDTSNIDYIYIHDEELDFITGTVKKSGGVPLTEQLHHGSRTFWWRDETMTSMTSLEATDWPVIVYQYNEAVKASCQFIEETAASGATYKVPRIKLGQGVNNDGVKGTGKLVKHTDSLEFSYTTARGKELGIWQRDTGYLDIVGQRKVTDLDFSNWDNGYFAIRTEGGYVTTGTVTFSGGVPTGITVGNLNVRVEM